MPGASQKGFLADEAIAAARLSYGFQDMTIRPLPGGRVNESFVLESGGRCFVLQKLNAIYEGSPSIGLNMKAVREAVCARGAGDITQAVPEIFPGLSGDLISASVDGAAFWRLSAHIAGLPATLDPAGGREAARLLGRLHRLLNSPAPIPLLPPPEAELTNQRLSRPEDFEALRLHYRGHPLLDELRPLIEQGAEAAWHLPAFPAFLDVFQLRELVIHGDPKADNFIFASNGSALALVDWDNICYGHVLIDVAEMLRSWGRPAEAQSPAGGGLRLENMAAVLEGYAAAGLGLSPEDLSLLPAVLRGISLTLARRYLTDALAGVFFRWDSERYPSLHIQNKTRAAAMLDWAEDLLAREMELADILQAAYARGKP